MPWHGRVGTGVAGRPQVKVLEKTTHERILIERDREYSPRFEIQTDTKFLPSANLVAKSNGHYPISEFALLIPHVFTENSVRRNPVADQINGNEFLWTGTEKRLEADNLARGADKEDGAPHAKMGANLHK